MNRYQPSDAGQRDGHALSVERVIDAPPEVIFDAFIAMYDSQRPDWVTGSQLDLRPGGRWSVDFQVPGGPAFREERMLSAVERPGRLAYDMTAVYEDAPTFSTTVEVTIEAVPGGNRIRLVQRGFPATDTRDEFAGAWPDVLAELARRIAQIVGAAGAMNAVRVYKLNMSTETSRGGSMGTVRVDEPVPGVRVITLDRPHRLNAMSGELISDLHRALDDAGADEEGRVVVLTGAGRGFCAGLDLKEPPTHRPGTANVSPQSRMHIQQAIAAFVPKLRGLRQPVIAAVNGPASGGGLALALACDIRIAAASATFNAAFVRIGLSGCDIGVSWLLPRLIGAGRSHELLLTGRLVDAAEADRIGLVNRVVPDGEVLDAALATAAEITANSPMGVWMTKEVAWSQLEVGSLQAGIDLENRTQIMTTFTRDHREQITAFVDKRPPHYTNE